MNLFETTITLDELPYYKELRQSTISRRGQKIRSLLIAVMTCIFMFMLFHAIVNGENINSTLPWLLVALATSITIDRYPRHLSLQPMLATLATKRGEKIASSVYRLKTPKPFEVLTLSFRSNGFDLKDDEIGVAVTVSYNEIRWIVETKNLFVLYGKRNHISGIIDKAALGDAESKESFSQLLKRNCTNARWDTSWALCSGKEHPKRSIKKKIAIFSLAALALSMLVYSFFVPFYVVSSDRIAIYRLDSLSIIAPAVDIIQYWTSSGYVIYFSDITSIELLPYSARQLSEQIDTLYVPPRRGVRGASRIAVGYFGSYYLNVTRDDGRFPTIWIERYESVPVLFSFANSQRTTDTYEQWTSAWEQWQN